MVILANKEVEYFSSPDWTEFADLPDGRPADFPVQPHLKNIF